MKILAGKLKVQDGIRPVDVKYIVLQSIVMEALVVRLNSTQVFWNDLKY